VTTRGSRTVGCRPALGGTPTRSGRGGGESLGTSGQGLPRPRSGILQRL